MQAAVDHLGVKPPFDIKTGDRLVSTPHCAIIAHTPANRGMQAGPADENWAAWIEWTEARRKTLVVILTAVWPCVVGPWRWATSIASFFALASLNAALVLASVVLWCLDMVIVASRRGVQVALKPARKAMSRSKIRFTQAG